MISQSISPHDMISLITGQPESAHGKGRRAGICRWTLQLQYTHKGVQLPCRAQQLLSTTCQAQQVNVKLDLWNLQLIVRESIRVGLCEGAICPAAVSW
eukprot:3933077-Rhodomonas_salina.3